MILPQHICTWTDAHWPALAQAGGLASVRFRVVDTLPFWSNAAAMTWCGEVLVRREWVAPALDESGNLNPRHMWAVQILAWHEPWHVIEQRQRSWPAYLLRYVWGCVKALSYRDSAEEADAYRWQAQLLELWRGDLSVANSGAIYWRPTT